MKCNSLIHSQLHVLNEKSILAFGRGGGGFIASLLLLFFWCCCFLNSYVHVTWPSFVFVELQNVKAMTSFSYGL